MWNDALQGYKPVENEDEKGFAPLKGRFRAKLNHVQNKLTKATPPKEKYELELEIVEAVEGSDKNYGKGRKLWKRYDVDNIEKVKELIDDLFTAGISMPTDSRESFESTFAFLRDKEVFVRAWSFPSKTKRDGSAYSADETPDVVQTFVIYNPSKVKNAKASEVPF